MPAYQASPIGRNVQQASSGLPAYAYGSLARTTADTVIRISTVQLTSPTAQVTGTVIAGNIPTVGQLVSISGAVPAYFNVTNATITSVSSAATPDVGVYTISFSLTNSNVPVAISSPGVAVAPQVEIGESLANGDSSAISIQSNIGPENGRVVRCDISFPTVPVAAVIDAYTADIDIDSEYSLLGNVATVSGSTVQGANASNVVSAEFTSIVANFIRFHTSGLSGSGKVVAKVTI